MSDPTICPQPGEHVAAGTNVLGEWVSTEVSREAVRVVGERGRPTRYQCFLGHEWPFRVSPEESDRDGDKLAAWLREAANELDAAHAILDELGAPRRITPESECECTLATRIALLADAVSPADTAEGTE